MNLSLFNIQDEYKRIASTIIDAGGEITPELESALQINQQHLQEKATNYGYIIKQSEYEADMIQKEIERLTAMKKARTNMVEKLKEKVSSAMELYGIEKIESSTIKLSFRKSEAIEIIDETAIPSEYLIMQPDKINKISIKEAIKSGEEVPGAVITTKFNLQIK